MSEENEGGQKPRWEKGDRAAIVAGRKNPLGIRGEVFWIGENKYGPGFRYGLRGDDGETYWCDETHLGGEESAPPPPDAPPAKPELPKGTRVVITGGREGVGEKGEIFWSGPSRYGPGMRYGVRASEDATFWVDERDLEPIEGEAPKGEAGAAPSSGAPREAARGDRPAPKPVGDPPVDDAPLPDPDEFADEMPIDDGAPFPDDIPF